MSDYVKHNFTSGQVLTASQMADIDNAIYENRTRLDENNETVDLLKQAFDPKKEDYIEIIKSTNLFNPADAPTGTRVYCHNAYIINSLIRDYTTDLRVIGNEGAYITTPPALSVGTNNIVTAQSWSCCVTHWLKVEKGKTYLFKVNNFIDQTSETTGNTVTYGKIPYGVLCDTNGIWKWELQNYNSTLWNENELNTVGYHIENGQTGSTYYGTTYAEILNKVSEGKGFTSLLINFKISGWIKFEIVAMDDNTFYGYNQGRTADDALTEENWRLLLAGMQMTETTDMNAPFTSPEDIEISKTKYTTTMDEIHNELKTDIQSFKNIFSPINIYSKNLYDYSKASNNYYIQQRAFVSSWNYPITSNTAGAGFRGTGTGRNLFSGWTKIKDSGFYTIKQFSQITSENTKTGYIGLVIAAQAAGNLIFMSTSYMGNDIGIDIGVEGTNFIKGGTSSINMISYTFEKLTEDEIYVAWFMSGSEGKTPSGYDFSALSNLTKEEAATIIKNTMIYKGKVSEVLEYEPYTVAPIRVEYRASAENIEGLPTAIKTEVENSMSNFSTDETITIANSDKIGFFGNSFLQGYTMKGQHTTQHLGSWLDYIIYNYSKSGDDILETLERVENNSTFFNAPIGPADFNLSYAIIAQQDNDGALHSFNYETYYENSKKLSEYLKGFGTKCILGTEHDSSEYYYGMLRLAREEGYMFMDWGYESVWNRPTTYKPFAHSGHPSTRTQWSWTNGMYKYLSTLPRPRKAIKIFNARDNSLDNSLLLYNTNIERARVWQDLSAGYNCYTADNEKYFDRLTESGALNTEICESEYMKLHAGQTVTCTPKILTEIITPYTSNGLKKIKVILNTTASNVYIKKDTSLKNKLSSMRYLAFGIGDNDESVFTVGATLVVSAGTTGNIMGSTIAGTYTIQGVNNGVVFTTKARPTETSGTDILEATVNGTAISNLIGSYDYPSSDYSERFNKPLCEWESIELDSNKSFSIDSQEEIRKYLAYDKISFLLEGEENITINEIKAIVSGDGEKNRENYKQIDRYKTGTTILSDKAMNLISTENSWTSNGEISVPEKVTFTGASSSYTEYYPSGSNAVIQLEKGSFITKELDFSRSDFVPPFIQVRITARRLPTVVNSDDIFTNGNEITHTYYPCGTMKVGLSLNTSNCDYFMAEEVGLHWFTYIMDLPLQARGNYLHIYSDTTKLQIARVEVVQLI